MDSITQEKQAIWIEKKAEEEVGNKKNRPKIIPEKISEKFGRTIILLFSQLEGTF